MGFRNLLVNAYSRYKRFNEDENTPEKVLTQYQFCYQVVEKLMLLETYELNKKKGTIINITFFY